MQNGGFLSVRPAFYAWSFRPRFKMVSIMPGMETLAPERTETRERVLLAAEVLAGNMLQIFELFKDRCTNVLCDLFPSS